MADNGDGGAFGFGKFVPGFDFLQNLAKGTAGSLPQMPNLSSWVAPTLNVEELEKRISELKAVHFWLDQNGKALAATIQALEVQKMTLATLKGMNFNMKEMAEALKVKPVAEAPAPAAAPAPAPRAARAGKAADAAEGAKAASGGAAPVDPLQWWGALTQQFQEIAANAMKDVAQRAETAAAAPRASPAKKAPARKTAAARSKAKPR